LSIDLGASALESQIASLTRGFVSQREFMKQAARFGEKAKSFLSVWAIYDLRFT
jgi:hypothetical protein